MEKLNLNQSFIQQCNNASQFDAGNGIARDAEATYNKPLALFENREGLTDEQREYLDQRADGWKSLVEEMANDHLRRRAAFVPVNVAGPSNYSSSQMNKRADGIMKSQSEWGEKMNAFLCNTQKHLEDLTPIETVLARIRAGKWEFGETFASDDPYVIEKLSAKRDHLKELHELRKRTNAYYRKHGTLRGCEGISDDRSAELDAKIADSFYGVPFPVFELRNGSASIRETEDRIKRIQAHRCNCAIQGFPFRGGHVDANYELDRLQIFFDEKPDEPMREALRGKGFHFSRTNDNAWQRQLTKNAWHTARWLLNDLLDCGAAIDGQETE